MTATRARGRLASQPEASSPSVARVAVGRSGRADAGNCCEGSPRPSVASTTCGGPAAFAARGAAAVVEEVVNGAKTVAFA
jgi:hypothetical protein